MFFSGLDSWNDVLIWHYVAAVLTSIVLIATTLILWAKNKWTEWKQKPVADVVPKDQNTCLSNTSEDSESIDSDAHQENDINADESSCNESAMSKSSAHEAEKVIKAAMTDEQRLLEYEVRRKQLSEIFQLMQREADKFGEISLSEVEEQMKLYQ